MIPKRRAAEKPPLSFCAQPIIATFRAPIGEREPGGAQRHHRPSRGFRDGGLADARLRLADVDQAFHAEDVELDGNGVDDDRVAEPASTSWICSLRVTFNPGANFAQAPSRWPFGGSVGAERKSPKSFIATGK